MKVALPLRSPKMKDADIVLMREMEENYWWHISRRLILQSILKKYLCSTRHSGKSVRTHPESYNLYDPGRSQDDTIDPSTTLRFTQDDKRMILDVGCGSGINMQWLKQFGEVVGVDSSPKAIEFCQPYGKTVLADATRLPFPTASFNLVTALDVLEHLKNDDLAIREWGRVLQPCGYLFISVPAHQWLFGSRDKGLGHYRRYSVSILSKLLRSAGFRLVFSSHIFALVFPFFVLQRIFFQRETSTLYPQLPPLMNSFLKWLSCLEIDLLKFMRFPFGGSIVILARKL